MRFFAAAILSLLIFSCTKPSEPSIIRLTLQPRSQSEIPIELNFTLNKLSLATEVNDEALASSVANLGYHLVSRCPLGTDPLEIPIRVNKGSVAMSEDKSAPCIEKALAEYHFASEIKYLDGSLRISKLGR